MGVGEEEGRGGDCEGCACGGGGEGGDCAYAFYYAGEHGGERTWGM